MAKRRGWCILISMPIAETKDQPNMDLTLHYSVRTVKQLALFLLVVLLIPVTSFAQQAPFYAPPKVSPRVLAREKRDSLRNYKHLGRAYIELGISEITPFILDKMAGK